MKTILTMLRASLLLPSVALAAEPAAAGPELAAMTVRVVLSLGAVIALVVIASDVKIIHKNCSALTLVEYTA